MGKKKNLSKPKLTKGSYVPSGLTREQYDGIRNGEMKKKADNYKKNEAKAGKFTDFTDWYLDRVYKGSIALTDKFIFTGNNIVYGPCPSCEVDVRVYFGGILGVEGFGDVASVKCTKCKDVINVQRKTLRASTLPKA